MFIILDNEKLFCHHHSSACTSHAISSSRAPLPWLSVRKTVSACLREVSLVLSISSGVDKKTDGTGEVRGPCYGWQVCLFGLSLISCFSPLLAPQRLCLWPDLEVTKQRWIKATFHQRVNTTRPTHHSGQLKTYGASVGLLPFSDKNNNWLIYTLIVELGLDTAGGNSTKTNMADTNSTYTYQISVMETEGKTADML